MREDEVEAMLAIDGAGLEVRDYKQWATTGRAMNYQASIYLPKDFHKKTRPNPDGTALVFTGMGETRSEAIANAWQKYQQFAETKLGLQTIQNLNKQLMFRI